MNHSLLSLDAPSQSQVLYRLLLFFLILIHFLFLFFIHIPSLGDLIKYQSFKDHLNVKDSEFFKSIPDLAPGLQIQKIHWPCLHLHLELLGACFKLELLTFLSKPVLLQVDSNHSFLLSQAKNLQVFSQILPSHEAYLDNVIQNCILLPHCSPLPPYLCYFVFIVLTSF